MCCDLRLWSRPSKLLKFRERTEKNELLWTLKFRDLTRFTIAWITSTTYSYHEFFLSLTTFLASQYISTTMYLIGGRLLSCDTARPSESGASRITLCILTYRYYSAISASFQWCLVANGNVTMTMWLNVSGTRSQWVDQTSAASACYGICWLWRHWFCHVWRIQVSSKFDSAFFIIRNKNTFVPTEYVKLR